MVKSQVLLYVCQKIFWAKQNKEKRNTESLMFVHSIVVSEIKPRNNYIETLFQSHFDYTDETTVGHMNYITCPKFQFKLCML